MIAAFGKALDGALDFAVAPGYTSIGYRLRGLSWESAVAGSLRGKAAVVTGASSGIGEAAAEGLARAGARVHMVVRDLERGERARERVARRLGSSGARALPQLELCDLSDLDAVRSFAADFNGREPDIAVLVNNAGALLGSRRRNAAGVELTFATNVLGPFALTELLLPALRAEVPGRVVNVSSGGMYTARLDAGDLQLDRRPFDGPAFYAHAKRAQVVLTELWAEREGDRGVVFASMHPGWADTPGLRRSLPRFRAAARPLLRDEREGADTIVWLATAPASAVPTGLFWHDRRPRPTHRLPTTRESAHDRRLLWDACCRLASPVGTEGDGTPLKERKENRWHATRQP
jgi:NAD(P)-dependent dehydrogenase (short-subunit alcohol dehydrogenase family)